MVATVSMQKPKVVVKSRNLIRSPRNMLIFSFFFCISLPINFVHRTLRTGRVQMTLVSFRLSLLFLSVGNLYWMGELHRV